MKLNGKTEFKVRTKATRVIRHGTWEERSTAGNITHEFACDWDVCDGDALVCVMVPTVQMFRDDDNIPHIVASVRFLEVTDDGHLNLIRRTEDLDMNTIRQGMVFATKIAAGFCHTLTYSDDLLRGIAQLVDMSAAEMFDLANSDVMSNESVEAIVNPDSDPHESAVEQFRKKMTIGAIVAVDKHGGIGARGSIPWGRLPGDMAHFKKETEGKAVVMGVETAKSMGKMFPLKGRLNIVVSSNPAGIGGDLNEHMAKVGSAGAGMVFEGWNGDRFVEMPQTDGAEPRVIVCEHIGIAIQEARERLKHVMIIGGERMYEVGLAECDHVWVTRVDALHPECDRFFCGMLRSHWEVQETRNVNELVNGQSGELLAYKFVPTRLHLRDFPKGGVPSRDDRMRHTVPWPWTSDELQRMKCINTIRQRSGNEAAAMASLINMIRLEDVDDWSKVKDSPQGVMDHIQKVGDILAHVEAVMRGNRFWRIKKMGAQYVYYVAHPSLREIIVPWDGRGGDDQEMRTKRERMEDDTE